MPWCAGTSYFPHLSAAGDAHRRGRCVGRSGCGSDCACLRNRPSVFLCHRANFAVNLSFAAADCGWLWHCYLISVCTLAAGEGRGSACCKSVPAAWRHAGRAAPWRLSGGRGDSPCGTCRTCPCRHTQSYADRQFYWRVHCRHYPACRVGPGIADCVAPCACALLCAGAARPVGHHPAGFPGAGCDHRLRARPVGAGYCGIVAGQYQPPDRYAGRRGRACLVLH